MRRARADSKPPTGWADAHTVARRAVSRCYRRRVASRRTFLKVGLGGSALLALGGLGLGLQSSALVEPLRPLKALSPQRYAVLAAFADAVLPSRGGLPKPRDVGVAQLLDDTFATLDAITVQEIGQVLDLLESPVAGLLLDARTRPFTQLDPDEQRALVTGWSRARIPVLRTAFRALFGLCGAAYWSATQLRGPLGYPGPQPWLLAARELSREQAAGASSPSTAPAVPGTPAAPAVPGTPADPADPAAPEPTP